MADLVMRQRRQENPASCPKVSIAEPDFPYLGIVDHHGSPVYLAWDWENLTQQETL